MSWSTAVAALLLALAVGTASLAAAGLVVLRSPARKLHALGLGSVVAPVAVGLAVAVGQPAGSLTVKALLLAVAAVAAAPVVSHAAARALHLRQSAAAERRGRRQ